MSITPSSSRFSILLLTLSVLSGDASGQLYRFGKNKVQYDEFRWQKMNTPHFDLYFYPEEEELATYAARMAEEGFAELQRKFAHTVQRRVPLIIYSSHVYFEQTNVIPGMLPEGVAGFTEFLKGRVALPLSGSMPDFERVLHHELVHVFMFDRIRTVLRSRGINQFRASPLWFSEGLAEFWSTDMDSYGDMIIRDALFSGRLVPISTMSRINGTFQLYKEGQSICAFMSDRYGEDVFERLLGNWWRSEKFEEIFEVTTGESLAELDKAWQYSVRKALLPDIEDADPPSQLAEALTTTGFNLKPVPIAASSADIDSLDLVFFRSDQGYTYIARQALTGGQPVVVVEGERSASYESLHPLGTSLAVTADGRWLAFSAKHGGRDRLHIWNLELGEEERTLSFDDIVAISSPSWSPDGSRLVFSGAEPGGRTDLYIVDIASGSAEALTDDIFHDRDPDWIPVATGFSSARIAGVEAAGDITTSSCTIPAVVPSLSSLGESTRSAVGLVAVWRQARLQLGPQRHVRSLHRRCPFRYWRVSSILSTHSHSRVLTGLFDPAGCLMRVGSCLRGLRRGASTYIDSTSTAQEPPRIRSPSTLFQGGPTRGGRWPASKAEVL